MNRISNIKAYDKDSAEINSLYVPASGIAYFTSSPAYITYDYSTNYSGSASAVDVPRVITVMVGLANNSFLFPPVPQNTEEPEYSGAQVPDDTTGDDTKNLYDGPGDASSNCNSGFGILVLAVLVFMKKVQAIRTKTKLFAVYVLLSFMLCSVAYADYAIPIPYEEYTTSGTWTTDFELTPELVNAITAARGVDASRVHSFADIALPGTWEIRPLDIYNLASFGVYGALTFPITESHIDGDFYVVRCTLGDDISEGERLMSWGFAVNTSTRETEYNEEIRYSHSDGIFFDEKFNRTYTVPDNKIIYAAVTLHPDYINTGVLSVVRGEYIDEDDPAERLDTTLLEIIAKDLSIDINELKYLTEEFLSAPREATPEMEEYVKSDDHEIIGGIVTVSVDAEGWYVFHVTLPDDVWEEVKSKDIDEFKLYGLADIEAQLSSAQVNASIIMGILNTLEIYTATGTKMKSFGVKEFFMAGFLNAIQPFTLFVAKALLSILTVRLTAGCNSGVLWSVGILGILIVKLMRRR